MKSKVAGYLEVGTNKKCEVVVNGGKAALDKKGAWHIVFSPTQARDFALKLLKHTVIAEEAALLKKCSTCRDLKVVSIPWPSGYPHAAPCPACCPGAPCPCGGVPGCPTPDALKKWKIYFGKTT